MWKLVSKYKGCRDRRNNGQIAVLQTPMLEAELTVPNRKRSTYYEIFPQVLKFEEFFSSTKVKEKRIFKKCVGEVCGII
jgi:hypothetical protein